jgi:hypothetical protein
MATATHFLPDAKTKVGFESLNLIASRKAKDGEDPLKAPDESKGGPEAVGSGAFLVHFWAVKKYNGLSGITFKIIKYLSPVKNLYFSIVFLKSQHIKEVNQNEISPLYRST